MIKKKDEGFTLIELTIAIAIFGFILLAMTQVIRQEVNLYNHVKQQDILEQKARSAMQVILDQTGLKSYKYYQNGSSNSGIYYNYLDAGGANHTACLLDSNPGDPLPSEIILYYQNGSLKYRDSSNVDHLVADEISVLTLSQASSIDSLGYYHFVQIDIETAKDGQSFHLTSMVRLN